LKEKTGRAHFYYTIYFIQKLSITVQIEKTALPFFIQTMVPVKIFSSINIPVPRERIFRRLGYRRGVTQVAPKTREEIDNFIEYAGTLIKLRGVGRRLKITRAETFDIILETGDIFKSADLFKYLEKYREVLLLGATGGNDIIRAINEDSEKDNLTRGVILDAVASEMVDASLDWLSDYFNHQLVRENRRLSRRRFSAGYGDFYLSEQRVIYDILELKRIGVDINENCILIPEKSVTAVVGIADKEGRGGEG
jgi:hypothetical protein